MIVYYTSGGGCAKPLIVRPIWFVTIPLGVHRVLRCGSWRYGDREGTSQIDQSRG